MNAENLLPKRYIMIAEAGRGFAALYVFVFHIIQYANLKAIMSVGTLPYYLVMFFGNYGHEAVLFFFLLSGFSIHYTSIDRPLGTFSGVLRYYYLRIRRIYPIYILAIILTLVLLYLGYSLFPSEYASEIHAIDGKVVMYNLAFLADRYYIEGIFAQALPTNGPLWSLSYEVLYYLIYPLYWLINRRLGQKGAMISFALLSILCITYTRHFEANHFTNVLSLYVIWVMGANVAQLLRSAERSRRSCWLCFTVAIYVLAESVWVLENATYTLGVYYEIVWGLLFFVVMLYFALIRESSIRRSHRIMLALTVVGGTIFIDLVSRYVDISKDMNFFYIKIHLTSMVFMLIAVSPKFNVRRLIYIVLGPFEKLGLYSYGLYIIHYPILFFTSAFLIHNQLNALYSLIIVPFIVLLAKYIEGSYHPYMGNWMDRIMLHKPRRSHAS